MDFATIEKEIQEFVNEKSAEQVYLEVKQTCVSVKHSSKSGSTVLAILWAKVLQHTNNFPQIRFPYKKHKDKNTGVEKLILKAEDVTLTVYMKNGTLAMQGHYILDWFKRRFLEILKRYDDPNYQDPVKPVYYPDVEENTATVTSSILRTVDLSNMTEKLLPGTPPPTAEVDNKPSDIDDLINTMDSLSLDVFDKENLAKELEYLQGGSVKNGEKYVYPLWKALLDKWIGNGWKVFVVTPFLDKERLMDIADILLSHKNNLEVGDLEAMYVRRKCDDPKIISQIKKEAQEEYTPNKQLYIEYRLFSKIIYPMQRFHCKFIAAVKEENAEILITSANFHAHHFDCDNMETVIFKKLTEKELVHKFLNPVISSVSCEVGGDSS